MKRGYQQFLGVFMGHIIHYYIGVRGCQRDQSLYNSLYICSLIALKNHGAIEDFEDNGEGYKIKRISKSRDKI